MPFLTRLLVAVLFIGGTLEAPAGSTSPVEKSCASNIEKSLMEMAVCSTCNVSSIYMVIGSNWQKIPLSAEQRKQALAYF